MKRIASFLAVALLTGALWAERVTVQEVQVRANDNFGVDPSADVRQICSVKPGWIADQSDIQAAMSADVKALLANPLYARVDVAIGQNEQGNWVVIYTVERRPLLAEAPVIEGLDGAIRLGKAEDAIKLTWNDRIDESIAAAAAGRLRDKLAVEGFVDAEVTFDLRYADKPGYAFLTLYVVPGTERKIRNYAFEGNTAFDHDALATSFGWLPFWNPLSWFLDMPLTDEKLDDARAAVLGVYTDAGYLDAEVATPELRQIPGKAPGRVDAVFQVTEGERYAVGTVKVEGATIYPAAALEAAAEQVLTERGRTATAATRAALRDAVELYYGSRGYVDTYAVPTVVPRIDEPVIDITYKLTEGVQVNIRNIEIRGNAVTQDKVIRRELVTQPGEGYDQRLVNLSQARIRNLGYFAEESGVTAYTIKTPNEHERDLVFEVREVPTMETMVGVSVSTVDSVFLHAGVSQPNFDLFNPGNGFRGGGQRASARAEIGSRRQTIDLSWTQPWLFDMPLSFTVNPYRKMRWFDEYDEIRMGAAFTLSWKPQPIPSPFGDIQLDRIGVRYTLEQVSYDDEEHGTWYTANGDKPFRFTDLDDGINSKFRFFWNEEHRNRPLFPTDGWNSQVYAELGVAGDAKDYGFGFVFNKYTPLWWDHVLQARLRFDTVEAYSGDVPFFDRYFIGGLRTIRGFEFRDGGPKAYQRPGRRGDHVSIGGQTLWCATLEYSIPINSVLRFAVFSDIGSVGEDFCDLGGDLLWSVGCGLRLDLARFPIRLDVAKPITNDDDTEEEVFSFSLGYTD